MVRGVIYSARHPGAGCLGGPCQGQPSFFLVQPACGLGEGMEGQVRWSGQGSRVQPQDLYQLSQPAEATATTRKRGRRGFLSPRPDLQFLTPPFPVSTLDLPPTWAWESQHTHRPPKEAIYQLGRGGKNPGRPNVPGPSLQVTSCVTLGNSPPSPRFNSLTCTARGRT